MDDKLHRQIIEDIKLFRGVAMILAGMIILSAVTFHYIEKWSWLDSLYYTIVTMATVGYGDFTPKTSVGKIFAMLLIVFGISLFGYFAQLLLKRQGERHDARIRKKSERKGI